MLRFGPFQIFNLGDFHCFFCCEIKKKTY